MMLIKKGFKFIYMYIIYLGDEFGFKVYELCVHKSISACLSVCVRKLVCVCVCVRV